eukprot:UN25251
MSHYNSYRQSRGSYSSSGPRRGGYQNKGGRRGGYDSNNPGQTLRDVNYTQADLTPFNKQFSTNTQPPLQAQVLSAWRAQHEITVQGQNVPEPLLSFSKSGLNQSILQQFTRLGFQAPTPIQSQSWPILLSGRDLIGIAQTGSGKTFAFLIPAIVHLRGQSTARRYGEGPSVVVVAPTRELACQIQEECQKVCSQLGVQIACAYGGAPRRAQESIIRRGVDIIICTPGRMLDFLERRTVNFRRVTMAVLDEADRMLDMGFEKPIRQILGQIRPDRQVALFSATWPREVQNLAREFTPNNSVFVKVGSAENQASDTITQKIVTISYNGEKEKHLQSTLQQYQGQKMLIFTSTKRMADRLSRQLNGQGYHTDAMHGDKQQSQRDWTLKNFKSGRTMILVATDVAARGIHVNDIGLVINYDFPNNCEDYVHRIGRTGRAGRSGIAISFFNIKDDGKKAGPLLKILRKNKQEIPPSLLSCSSMSYGGGRYRGNRSRFGGGRGGGRGRGRNSYGGGRGRGGSRGRGGMGRSRFSAY